MLKQVNARRSPPDSGVSRSNGMVILLHKYVDFLLTLLIIQWYYHIRNRQTLKYGGKGVIDHD